MELNLNDKKGKLLISSQGHKDGEAAQFKLSTNWQMW